MFSANTKEAAFETASNATKTAYSAKRDLKDAAQGIDLNDVAAKAGRQVRSMIDAASDQLADASDKIVSEVRANPVRSSAIALGLGLVLGALFRR